MKFDSVKNLHAVVHEEKVSQAFTLSLGIDFMDLVWDPGNQDLNNYTKEVHAFRVEF